MFRWKDIMYFGVGLVLWPIVLIGKGIALVRDIGEEIISIYKFDRNLKRRFKKLEAFKASSFICNIYLLYNET